VSPKDLFSREAVRAIIEDLDLNRARTYRHGVLIGGASHPVGNPKRKL
jgi:hypothetical protein